MTTNPGLIEAQRIALGYVTFGDHECRSEDEMRDLYPKEAEGFDRQKASIQAAFDAHRALLIEATRVIAWYSAQSYPHDAMEGLIERLREAAGKETP